MLTLLLLAALPAVSDVEPPAAALTAPSSVRMALPVTLRFDDSLTDHVTPLVKKTTGAIEAQSRDPLWALARFAPGVARRHFEQAAWGPKGERSVVVKSVSVVWTDGPSYEARVVVDRYEGERRLGQATGSGYAMADRSKARLGAAWAGPFAPAVNLEVGKAKPEEDGAVIRQATVAALDSALLQLAQAWAGEQLVAQARADAEALLKKNQPARAPKR